MGSLSIQPFSTKKLTLFTCQQLLRIYSNDTGFKPKNRYNEGKVDDSVNAKKQIASPILIRAYSASHWRFLNG
jgi:hypothetical protein